MIKIFLLTCILFILHFLKGFVQSYNIKCLINLNDFLNKISERVIIEKNIVGENF